MDYRKLSDADLADFSKNVREQLVTDTTGLDRDLAAELAATLTTLNTDFEAQVEEGVAKAALRASVIADKQSMREDLLARLSKVRNYLVAATLPKKSFEICGFTYPSGPSTVVPNDPTDLVATGSSNGVNRISFSGNNRTGSVTYEIWRLHGDTAPFTIIATTKRQSFVDTPVTPGQYYNYKVRAVAARSVSNFSNIAVVYGAI